MIIISKQTSLICPRNDGEATLIIEIALRLSFDVRVSQQAWGATLSNEPDETFYGLRENVIIVEMPDLEKEEEIKRDHTLYILDHHRYEGLDRTSPKSALEQFTELADYKLNRRETGVAINDRSYIPGLRQSGYSEEEIREIRAFDLAAQGYGPLDFQRLEEDYRKGYSAGDVYVIETTSAKTAYLSDLHVFEGVKTGLTPNLAILLLDEGGMVKKASFSGNPILSKALFSGLGGYSGGDEKTSTYWGREFSPAVSKDECLARLKVFLRLS